MRITRKRRDALQLLIDAVVDQDALMDREEYRNAVLTIRYALAGIEEPKEPKKWLTPRDGQKILCDCGEQDCYHTLEIHGQELFFHTDPTDREVNQTYRFILKPKYALLKDRSR